MVDDEPSSDFEAVSLDTKPVYQDNEGNDIELDKMSMPDDSSDTGYLLDGMWWGYSIVYTSILGTLPLHCFLRENIIHLMSFFLRVLPLQIKASRVTQWNGSMTPLESVVGHNENISTN